MHGLFSLKDKHHNNATLEKKPLKCNNNHGQRKNITTKKKKKITQKLSRWGKTALTIFIKRRKPTPDLENSQTPTSPERGDFFEGMNPR
jgi:hypothetical protein